MTINNIEQERTRVLAVICPLCSAAAGALCTIKYYNGAGSGMRFTNIFHAERVVKAQTMAEKAMDLCTNIRLHLNKEKS